MMLKFFDLDFDFDSPMVVDLNFRQKPSPCDITINDLETKDIPEDMKPDFTVNNKFNQKAYRMAIRNKLSFCTKSYALSFFLYHFEIQEKPLTWLDSLERTLRFYETNTSDKKNRFEHDNSPFINAKEMIDLILSEPKYHFENLKVNQQKSIKLNLSLPEIRIFNQLLVGAKLINQKDLNLLESILSNNFTSKGSHDKIRKTSLSDHRMDFEEKNIDSITALLSTFKTQLKNLQEKIRS